MSNEGKACDAVIRLLEKRTGNARANLRRSEMMKGLPPVEVDFDLGGEHFAVEHTKLETFANQTRLARQSFQLIEEDVLSLSGHLPAPGTYKLWLPIEPVVGRSMTLTAARAAIRDWVAAAAAKLHARHPERHGRNWEPFGHHDSIAGAPDGLPFEITLSRQVHWSLGPRYDGVLTVGRLGPPDVEAQRVMQMVRALDRKCPKLCKFKHAGARTVLVLEDADLSLSNHFKVSEAFEAACAGRDDLPDEVYVVSTVTSEWTVWSLKVDDRIELSETFNDYPESLLDDVTVSEGLT